MKLSCTALLLLIATLGLPPAAQAQDTDEDGGETPAAGTDDEQAAEQNEQQGDTDESETSAGCDCPPPPVEPETDAVSPESNFNGEGGLGWIVNSGNTNNESFNGNLAVKYKSNAWLHTFTLSGKRVEEENVTTAERYLFTGKTDYNYDDNGYAFAAVRYDDDEFDGFEYQASLSTGLGWHIINTDDHHFDTEFGFGYRRNEPAVTAAVPADRDEPSEEIIGRFAEHYDVRFTESTRLFQDLLVESGDSNTTTEFALGLKVDVNDSVALQVSYNVKHNSDPPPSGDPTDPTEKTDRTTRVTLVFGF